MNFAVRKFTLISTKVCPGRIGPVRTIQSCRPPPLETGPPPANYTPFHTNRSKQRFEPNHLGSTSLRLDQYLPVCYPSTSSNNENILSPSLPVSLALSTSNTSHDQDLQLPYGEHVLPAPDTLAYGYAALSPANHSFLDTTFNIDPTGFELSPNNSFPCPPRSTEASNQDSALHVGPHGFGSKFRDSFDRLSDSAGAGSENSSFHIDATGFDESSNCSIPRPSSSSEAGNQNSHYSESETRSMSNNSPGNDGLNNDHSLPPDLSLSTTRNAFHLPVQTTAAPFPAPDTKRNKPLCTDSGIRKRNLNTLAARRYRQKRTDETQALAAELKETKRERDDLKVLVARLEGELKGLRQNLHVESD
ncbi:hypothetical protein BDR22DRAFT_826038 [Usnea florida]